MAVAEARSGARWFHNKWRFDQRRLLLVARLGLAEHDAAAALAAVEQVVAGAEERGDARYAVLGRLVLGDRSGAARRAGGPERLTADLDHLGEVAALEGWWLAADVADATGSPYARATAARLAEPVAREAGELGEAFRNVAAARLG